MKEFFLKEERLWWLVILIALILPRLVTLWIPILSSDETIYATFGKEILHGALPYQDIVDIKPPLIYYFYASFFWLGGEGSMVLIHLAHLVVVALVCWVLFQIGTILANRQVGWWAALFYAIFSAAGVHWDFLATNAEPLMVLPLSLAVLFLFRSDLKFSFWKDFLGGIFLGIAFLIKYTSGINLPLTLLYLGILCPLLLAKDSTLFKTQKERGMGHFVSRSVLYVVGFSVPILLLLFYFGTKGILAEFYFWSWAYNFSYIAQGGNFLSWDYYILKILVQVFILAMGGFLIWVLGLKQAYKTIRSWGLVFTKKNSSGSLHFLFCILWFLLSFIPISLGGRLVFHYFIQLIPPLCLLAALPASQIWTQKKYRPAMVIFNLLPFLIFMPESTSLLWSKKKNYEMLGEYIQKHSTSQDKIFIWGFFPSGYFFSKRRPASRFLFCDFLTGATFLTPGMDFDPLKPQERPSALSRILMDLDPKDPPLRDYDTSKYIVPKAWPLFFEDMKKNKPLYFIDTSPANIHRFEKYPLNRFPELKKFIENNYQLEKTIAGIDLYKRKKSSTSLSALSK